jgi:histidinol-phosphate aminotransferase
MNDFLNIAAPAIGDLKPYVPGKPISELERELGISHSIKLASNENPLGASPKVAEAIQAALPELARYPDGGGFELRQALAQKHNIDADRVTLGNGSNDVLDMVARVFLRPGTESLFSQYAFAVYPISSQAVGADLVIAAAKDYAHDLVVMREKITPKTRVVWIANPNNPTGTWTKQDELYSFIQDLPQEVIVVVDEAYTEYVAEPDYPDASQWLDEFPNLIVTRTFSKAYGLASLRLGYALSHADVADLLNRVRQPFNANALAQVAALAALQDQAFIEQSVKINQEGMEQLLAGLDQLGIGYIPSVGNFITVDFSRDAAEIDQALLERGCITRPLANYGMPNHLRFTIGLREENERLLSSLREVMQR